MKNTLGLSSEASARGIWARLKKKVFGEGGTSAALADAIATTGKARSPRKSNKAAKSAAASDEATAEEDDVDNADASTESKWLHFSIDCLSIQLPHCTWRVRDFNLD